MEYQLSLEHLYLPGTQCNQISLVSCSRASSLFKAEKLTHPTSTIAYLISASAITNWTASVTITHKDVMFSRDTAGSLGY